MSDGELEFPEIKPVWKGKLIPYEAVEKLERQLAELKHHCKLLREVTKELADEVEAYANAERELRFDFPHIMAKWERDMEPVNRARTLLKQGGSNTNPLYTQYTQIVLVSKRR